MASPPSHAYPDPPIDGGYTTRHKHQGSIGPQGLADAVLDLTNPDQVRMGKQAGQNSTPPARPTLRAEPGVLDQLIHALAQLHGEERQHG